MPELLRCRLAALPLLASVLLFAYGCAARANNTARPASQRSVAWAIFVDDLHLDFRHTGRLRDLLRQIAKELVQEGDVFAIRSSGPSSITVPFTPYRSFLDPAIKKLAGNGLKPTDFLDGGATPTGMSEVRYRAGLSLSAALRMMSDLRDHRGGGRSRLSKGFVYISNGYYFDAAFPHSDIRVAAPHSGSMPNVSVPELRQRMASLPALAKKASVKVFAIDARMAAPLLDLGLTQFSWEQYWTTTQRSLLTLSHQTGGFALLERKKLPAGITRVNHTVRGGS